MSGIARTAVFTTEVSSKSCCEPTSPIRLHLWEIRQFWNIATCKHRQLFCNDEQADVTYLKILFMNAGRKVDAKRSQKLSKNSGDKMDRINGISSCHRKSRELQSHCADVHTSIAK